MLVSSACGVKAAAWRVYAILFVLKNTHLIVPKSENIFRTCSVLNKQKCPLVSGHFCCKLWFCLRYLVGAIGLEPTTPTMSRWCSNQLSYAPVVLFDEAIVAWVFHSFFES